MCVAMGLLSACPHLATELIICHDFAQRFDAAQARLN
jgi:hypothetical protein